MNDLTALRLLSNFMKRVNVTGVEEAQALLEVNRWLQEKEQQILNAVNGQQTQQVSADTDKKQQ